MLLEFNQLAFEPLQAILGAWIGLLLQRLLLDSKPHDFTVDGVELFRLGIDLHLQPRARFVDIGIIGGPPGEAGPGPRLYASGADAEALLPLRDWGIDLRAIAGGIGAASALKMSYAGITKGLTALGSAMALGAVSAGAAAALHAELSASQPELMRYFSRSVPDMFDKAYRWVAEMEEIAAFLGESPAAPIYAAMARHYEALAADRAATSPAGKVADLARFFAAKP